MHPLDVLECSECAEPKVRRLFSKRERAGAGTTYIRSLYSMCGGSLQQRLVVLNETTRYCERGAVFWTSVTREQRRVTKRAYAGHEREFAGEFNNAERC